LHTNIVADWLQEIGREDDRNVRGRHLVDIRAFAHVTQKPHQVLDRDAIADWK